MDNGKIDSGEAPQRYKRKLRNLLLRPAFQWKCVATIVLGVFFISSFIGVLLYGVLYEQVRARTLFLPTSSSSETIMVLVGYALAFAAVPAIAFGLWNIVLTHRICGPLFAMESSLAKLGQGKFPQRRPLRKKDEFKEFHQMLWCTIDRLKDRKKADFEALNELRNVACSASDGDDRARAVALDTIVSRLDLLCSDAATALGVDYKSEDAACPSTVAPKESALPVPCTNV